VEGTPVALGPITTRSKIIIKQDFSGWREPQVPPLRCASVGMTSLRVALSGSIR
jgi:hypothetical protein